MDTQTPSLGALATPESPWLGLRSFNEETQSYFFGRGAELEDLYERILDKPLTILFGQSGLGKSSLIQAAIIPRLRSTGFLPVFVRFNHEEDAQSLEHQLLYSLQAALESQGFDQHASRLRTPPGRLAADSSAFLWLLFHDAEYGFITGRGRSSVGVPKPVFLIDQFEEIFTLGDRPRRRPASLAFQESIAALVENRPPGVLREMLEDDEELALRLDYKASPVRVLLSLREDFLHLLERWRRIMPALMENRFELRMLNGPQALEAVIRPGQIRTGSPPIISDEVGQAIVRFVARVEDDVPLAEIDAVPPLLSLICAELNSQRLAEQGTQVTRAQFEGNSDEILLNFYRRSFDLASYSSALRENADAESALPALQRLIEDRLLSPDGYRENIAFDTIARELTRKFPAETVKAVLDQIVDRRLLTIEERGGVRRLELAHDVLAPIVRASRDERQENEALAQAQRDKERAEAETRTALAEKHRLRRLAIVAIVCAAIATVGAAFGIIGMVRARQAAAEAARGFDAARSATDEFLSKVASDELAFVSGIQGLREDLSNKAISQYDQMLQARPQDFALRFALAKAHLDRAKIRGQIGSVDETISSFLPAIDELAGLQKGRNDQEVQLSLAEAYLNYAKFRDSAGLSEGPKRANVAIALATPLLDSSHPEKAARVIAWAYNLLGNNESDRVKKIELYQKGRDAAMKVQIDPQDNSVGTADLLMALSAATWNLSRQAPTDATAEEKSKFSVLEKEGRDIDQRLHRLQPDSPKQQQNIAITYQWDAEELQKAGRTIEARQKFEKAVALTRQASLNNPNVTSYHADFIRMLKDYGIFVSRLNDFNAARLSYQEAEALTDKILGVRAERPAFDATLLEVLNQLSDFEQYGKANNSKGNPQDAAAIRKRAIELGRGLIARYPDSVDLLANYCQIVVNQARDEPVSARPKEAAELLREATALMERQRQRNAESLRTNNVSNYLNWEVSLDDILTKFVTDKEGDREVLQQERSAHFSEALEWESLPTSYDAKESLLEIAVRQGEIYREAGAPEKAIALYKRVLAIGEPALAEKPHYWYLRQAVAGVFRDLGKAYQQTGAVADEVRARQKAIEIGYVRDYGAKVFETVLKADAEPTEEFLAKIRTVDDWKPRRKMFVFDCEVNGVKVPVQFFIHGGVPAADVDPLADQAQWILEERGVRVPEEVRSSLRKVAGLAHQNNMDLVSLCDEALNAPTGSQGKKTPSVADVAELQLSAGVKVGVAKADPRNAAKQKEAASALEALADAYLEQGQGALPEAKKQLLDMVDILQRLFSESPEDKDARRRLGLARWKLGKVYRRLKEEEKMLQEFNSELDLARAQAKDSPTDVETLRSLAESLGNLQTIKDKPETRAEARRFGEELVELREEILAQKPDDPDRIRELAVDLHTQGKFLCLMGWSGISDSLSYLERAAQLLQKLKADGKLDSNRLEWVDIAQRWSGKARRVADAKRAYRKENIDSVARLGVAVLEVGIQTVGVEITNEAIELLNAVPDNYKDAVAIQKLIASSLRELGRDDEALTHLSKWLRVEPGNPDALDTQGDIHFKAKRFERAAESYKKLLQLMRTEAAAKPSAAVCQENMRAWLNFGVSLVNADKLNDAEREYLEALSWCTAPERKSLVRDWEKTCRQKLVGLYLTKKKIPEALIQQQAVSDLISADLEANEKDMNSAAQARGLLATLQNASDQAETARSTADSALKLWRRLLAVAPSQDTCEQCYSSWVAYVEITENLGKKNDALISARELLEFCSSSEVAAQLSETSVRSDKVSCHRILDRLLTALRSYDEATVETEAAVALCKEALERTSPGSSDYERAKEELVSSYGNHSWALLLARKFDQALLSARASFKLEQKIWIEANLAHALLFAGHVDEAMAIYKKHRGAKLEINNGASWEATIKDDFERFRKAGLDHGDFPKVEAELGIGKASPGDGGKK